MVGASFSPDRFINLKRSFWHQWLWEFHSRYLGSISSCKQGLGNVMINMRGGAVKLTWIVCRCKQIATPGYSCHPGVKCIPVYVHTCVQSGKYISPRGDSSTSSTVCHNGRFVFSIKQWTHLEVMIPIINWLSYVVAVLNYRPYFGEGKN